MFASTIIIDPRSEIRAKQSFDTYIVTPNLKNKRAAIRLDDIKALPLWSSKASFGGGLKRIIFEQFQTSTAEVSHALLKLLEEPPAQTHIVLLVDKRDSVIETILSRCVIIEAKELSDAQLTDKGLIRIDPYETKAALSWAEFKNKPKAERLSWGSAFIKNKKDLVSQLMTWQGDLSQSVQHSQGPQKITTLQQLLILEESLQASASNVLPRLILTNLIVKVH